MIFVRYIEVSKSLESKEFPQKEIKEKLRKEQKKNICQKTK
jgi:hypothetical protein